MGMDDHPFGRLALSATWERLELPLEFRAQAAE